jgi:hypothetical protein
MLYPTVTRCSSHLEGLCWESGGPSALLLPPCPSKQIFHDYAWGMQKQEAHKAARGRRGIESDVRRHVQFCCLFGSRRSGDAVAAHCSRLCCCFCRRVCCRLFLFKRIFEVVVLCTESYSLVSLHLCWAHTAAVKMQTGIPFCTGPLVQCIEHLMLKLHTGE